MREGTGAICLAVHRPSFALLRQQLRSIAAQTVTDWVCHVGIDGRDVATEEAVHELVGNDDRFVVHAFDENLGCYLNFERLLGLASDAAWIALADQDDAWYPEKIARLVKELEPDGVTLVVGQARVVDASGATLGYTRRKEVDLFNLLIDNQVTGSLSVFDPAILAVALPFPNATDAAYHDHWIGVCAKAMGEVIVVNEVLQDYVQHTANVIGEERGVRPISRFRALVTRAEGDVIGHLAEHRWGWRVRMARTVLSRYDDAQVRNTLAPVASGRLGPAAALRIGRAALRGDVALMRGAALVAGGLRGALMTDAVGHQHTSPRERVFVGRVR